MEKNNDDVTFRRPVCHTHRHWTFLFMLQLLDISVMRFRWTPPFSLFIMDLEDCKKSRKSAKGKVTRLCNKLSQVITEDDDLQSVSELIVQLKRSFSDFTS